LKKFKYVYGPVPSRRLGRSLGVNPIPFKTCNYSCVYCQLGRTLHLINERKSFFPKDGDDTEAMTNEAYEIVGPTFISLKSDPMLVSSITKTKQ
jgi:wyosine [tRNA(Phe)-imidazoG37] synthetase (radical SAM superfamily)